MADAGADGRELAALRQQIERFPEAVTAQLRAVAWRTSRRVKDRALQILNARTNGKADRIALITIDEHADRKEFRVIAEGAADKPANLALWFEKGTRFMEAKPFMRPAGDAEEAQYRSEMTKAAETEAEKLAR